MGAAHLQAAWPVLLGVAARTTPLFLAALLADRLLRRRSASLRHALWRATLYGTITLAIGIVALPGWRVALLPPLPMPAMHPAVAPLSHAGAGPATPAPGARESRAVAPTAASAAPLVPVDAAIVAIWMSVAAALLLRMLLDRRALARCSAMARPAGEHAVTRLASRIAHDLGITRPVRVLLHDDAIIPCTFGVLRPTLLLPYDAVRWPEERQARVITHELAHVQRGDALECLLMRFVAALLWFHPGIRAVSRRLAATREAACDDIVLLRGARASAYATDLLETVRSARATRTLAAAPAMARPSELGARVTHILDATCPRTLDARASRRLMGAACVILALPLAAVQPVPRLVTSPARDIPSATAVSAQAPSRSAPVVVSPTPRHDARMARLRRVAPRGARTGRPQRDAIVFARLATLDSICAIINGRTRGERLVALADQWIEDARVLDAYFRVLDGIPDARVRADVVTHALTASRSPATRERARVIIEGLPDRRLRDVMVERLAEADEGASDTR